MNYIYDVLTNFSEKYYDFYEWEKNDKLIHFKKIPVLKISKEDYTNIFTNKIKIDNELLNKIKNKAEIWRSKDNKNNYFILLTNRTDIIGIEFNKEGISTKRSSLIVDEELDILETQTIRFNNFSGQFVYDLKEGKGFISEYDYKGKLLYIENYLNGERNGIFFW